MTAPRFFRARMAKAGPFIGVRMFFGPPVIDGEELDRSPRWQVTIGAETTSRAVLMLAADEIPVEVEDVLLRSVEAVTEAEWQYLVAHQAWATEHAPNHPKAEPRRAVDFNTIPLPF